MKSVFTILASFIFFFQSYSQDLINTQTLVESNFGSIYTFDRSDKTIQGNPYIFMDFSPARVSASEDKIYNLRYNAVSDEIEVETDKNTIHNINKNIKNVSITFLKDNKTYQALNYLDKDGAAQRGYFVFVTNTDQAHPLLVKEVKKFIERQPAKSSYQEGKPAHFKRLDDAFYIIYKNETALRLPKNKKDIANLFPDNSKDILSFIKSNKIKTSSKDSLIKLVNYINTL